MKPMLAVDYDESKLTFPKIMMPKIDGVRAMNFFGYLHGRSLKKFRNPHANLLFSLSALLGLDGEMVVGGDPVSPSLCRDTAGALGRGYGTPAFHWHIFDYVTQETARLPYEVRLEQATRKVAEIERSLPGLVNKIHVVSHTIVNNLPEMQFVHDRYSHIGFEGSILRDPAAPYKFGRATLREGSYLRIKDFDEDEAVVNSIIEGQKNNNEATINELGQTERSTHQANMAPNGMVGALLCTDVKTGKKIQVAAGCMTHDERLAYFQQPQTIVGHTIIYRNFKKGVKDKPRFPTFQSIKGVDA